MKRWVNIEPPKDFDPRLSDILLRMNLYMRDLQAGMGAVARGDLPVAGGGSVVVGPYLYLPGRDAGQFAKLRVQFDAKIITAGGTAAPPNQKGLGLRGVQSDGQPVEINFSIEEASSTLPDTPTREWIFPSFRDQGETTGTHYFVDESNVQRIASKFMVSCSWETFDVAGVGFAFDVAGNRNTTGTSVQTFNLLFSGGFPTTRWPYSLSNPVGKCQPHIYIPPLDYSGESTDPTASVRDKTHVFPIIKVPAGSTSTPFEDGGPIYGGGTRRELYSMPGRAIGDLPIATSGSVLVWYPSVTATGTFQLDVPPGTGKVVTSVSSTTGMYAGMRVRISGFTNTALPEDTFIVSVDSATQITLNQAWTGSNAPGTSFVVFGPVWRATLPSSVHTSWNVVSKTANYTATSADDLILCSASGGAFQITLPTAVGITGRMYTIKKTDSTVNGVTVGTTSSQTIDGQTTQVMTIQYTSISVVSDGANWVIV